MLALVAAGLVYLFVLAGTLWLAIARGVAETRTAGWITLAGVVATQIAAFVGPQWKAFDPGIMAIDAAMVIGYGSIALRTAHWWPLWMTAAQLSATLTHVAPLVSPEGIGRLYQWSQPAWMFLVLGAVAWGSLRPRLHMPNGRSRP